MRRLLFFCAAVAPCALGYLQKELLTRQSSACFINMMAGSRSSTGRKNKKALPREQVSAAVPGELPDDAFAMYPPLSEQQQATLKKAEDLEMGPGESFPQEAVNQIKDKYGFTQFDEKLFPGIRLLHADPVVFEVEDFFTPEECDAYIAMSTEKLPKGRKAALRSMELRSATTSAASQFQQQRTSTTWFHHYVCAPELVAKASALLGVEDISLWEEPQTVRYRPGEKFSWHLDALPPAETGASKGGQRTATVLVAKLISLAGYVRLYIELDDEQVYLTNMQANAGGATAFRDLGPLRVRPKKGKCLVFFPSFGGQPGSPFDVRTLHAGEVVGQGKKAREKYIAQLWCHKKPYPAAVPEGNSHEAGVEAIADYTRRWRGES